MGWVTSILLLLDLEEVIDDESDNVIETPAPVHNINAWLEKENKRSLCRLDDYIETGKILGACVYGGAFNFLNIEEFISTVRIQSWKQPQNVQLLVKGEEDNTFTLHSLTEQSDRPSP